MNGTPSPGCAPIAAWIELIVARMISPIAVNEPAPRSRERVAQRAVRALELPDPVALREPLDGDRGRHQIVSANRGSERRKYESPTTKIVAIAATLTIVFPSPGGSVARTPH